MGKKYGDIPRGIFVVRGENVVLLGEIVSKRLPLPARCLHAACGRPGAEPLVFVVTCDSKQRC